MGALGIVAALAAVAGNAQAVNVLITASTTIGAGQTTITPTAGGTPVPLADADITVQGASTVLTIDTESMLTIQSLVVQTSAKIQPTAGTRMHLNITQNATIDGTSSINADGRGSTSTTGPGVGQSQPGWDGGGGGYGGAGGFGAQSTFSGGNSFAFDLASLSAPILLGARGGNAWLNGAQSEVAGTGGAGGGAIKLQVNGTLTVDGLITSNGLNGVFGGGGEFGGGGSGGSIFVTANTITGTGTIRADGGLGDANDSGGGGGGRISVVTCSGVIPNNPVFSVNGGVGANSGQPGTVVSSISPKIAVQPNPSLVVRECDDNAQLSVRAFGTTSGLAFQWQYIFRFVGGFPDWQPVANGTTTIPGLTISGATTDTLTLTPTTNFDSTHIRRFRCRVTPQGSCTNQAMNSAEGAITQVIPCCVADFDDGSATGTPDGAVTIDDLLYYLSIFSVGVNAADVDDGTGTGVTDGAVTIDDLLHYLTRFQAGC